MAFLFQVILRRSNYNGTFLYSPIHPCAASENTIFVERLNTSLFQIRNQTCVKRLIVPFKVLNNNWLSSHKG